MSQINKMVRHQQTVFSSAILPHQSVAPLFSNKAKKICLFFFLIQWWLQCMHDHLQRWSRGKGAVNRARKVTKVKAKEGGKDKGFPSIRSPRSIFAPLAPTPNGMPDGCAQWPAARVDISGYSDASIRSRISLRHMGHTSSCRAHSLQNPLCWQGSSRTAALRSKHRVQESSRTVLCLSFSIRMCLGRMTLSSSVRWAKELKQENWTPLGGNLNGERPKLNSHCWKVMKLAAAKKPDLAFWKTCVFGGSGSPLR